MKGYLWMKVTNDAYELPLAVASSASELAKMLHVTTKSIYSNISKSKKYGRRCVYKRVKEDENETN